jgi:type II secretory pathway component PulF
LFNFEYQVRDNTGKLVTGAMTASSGEEVADKLQRLGFTPVKINRVFDSLNLGKLVVNLQRIKTQDIVMFNIQFANMLSAGLGIVVALETLEKQCTNKKFGQIIGNICRGVEAGESLSQAFSKYPKLFPHVFVSMVRAAEASGDLSRILNRYAEFAEAQAELRKKIKEALFYPVILITAAVGVIVFLSTFLIPKFVEVFNRADIELPLPTIILYIAGTTIRRFWYLIILAVVLVIFGIKKYIGTKSGRLKFDTFCLKMPVLGSIVRKACISRFARTLATLADSGVPILESLSIVKEVVNNMILGRVVEQMRESVEKGESLAESLKISKEFPADAVQMISVGERSGNIEDMLNKVGDFYDRSISYSIKKLVASLEPTLLVIMGVVAAFTMASMLMPMFDMAKLLQR